MTDKKIPDFFSKYSLQARLFPSTLGLLPFFIFQYYYLDSFFPDLINLKIIGNIPLSLVILYFISEFVVRYLGKLYEDWLFDNKLNFPTTNFVLFKNREYSRKFKHKIRDKIAEDFDFVLPDEGEEVNDEMEARKRIKEAIGLIIGKVKDGHLVLKHSIAYGFTRNLWGASIVGLIFSFLLFVFSSKDINSIFFLINIALLLFYLLYIILGQIIIKYFGKNYARKLIEEYLSNYYGKQ
jgi:hypothetical protein